jgi:hypothetical protein
MADELRDADSEPCDVCDAMLHRMRAEQSDIQTLLPVLQVSRRGAQARQPHGWEWLFHRVFSKAC